MKTVKNIINTIVFFSIGISIQSVFMVVFGYLQKTVPHDFWYYLLACMYVITVVFIIFKMKKHQDFFKIFK